MKYLTAGESHGKCLTAILEGFPAGVKLDTEQINKELKRRQSGYGRGGRMSIESDELEITAGMFGSVTIGSPIAFFIRNRDYEKWTAYTDTVTGNIDGKTLTAVRPGHADYVGCVKYGFNNARCVLERASARETAARVGIGAICKQLLEALGITVASHVTAIGGVRGGVHPESAEGVNKEADSDPVRCLDAAAAQKMIKVIDGCRETGDTAGGEVEIIVSGVPVGIGSYVSSYRKLDGILTKEIMSVQAVKSVGIGMGNNVAEALGSKVHDEMYYAGGKVTRRTNNAGGIEGGVSNGENIIIKAAIKPIPTLMSGLDTVDIKTHKATVAAPERSDYCAVPAAGVVIENVAAYVILNELLTVTGGDDFVTIRDRVQQMRAKTL